MTVTKRNSPVIYEDGPQSWAGMRVDPNGNWVHKDAALPQDIIKAIAEDIGKDLVAYIEVMYPDAIKATSSTFKLSMRNHVYNSIMESVKLSDVEKIRQRLAANAAHRKKWVGMYRKMRRPSKQGANK